MELGVRFYKDFQSFCNLELKFLNIFKVFVFWSRSKVVKKSLEFPPLHVRDNARCQVISHFQDTPMNAKIIYIKFVLVYI